MKPARRTSLEFNKSYAFWFFCIGIIAIALAGVLSQLASTENPRTGQSQPVWNGQQPNLPQDKSAARQFEKQYNSGFNFDQNSKLNRDYSGSNPALDTRTAPPATPAAPLSVPALPTIDGKPVKALNACPIASDIFESDNSPQNLTLNPIHLLEPGTVQKHALSTSSTGASASVEDVDWVYLNVVAGSTYTISSTPVTTTSGLQTAVNLYTYDSINNTTTLLVQGDNNSSGGSTLTYPAQTTAQLYARIQFGLVPSNTLCGEYNLQLDTFLTPTPTPTTGPSPTPTQSPTPTSTPLITSTATPIGPCTDNYENDGNPQNAKLIKISQGTSNSFSQSPGLPSVDSANDGTQQHYMCTGASDNSGDVDWVYFDLVKGKPYSIFTSKLANGLDSFMVLYTMNADGSMNPLYSSDDYPGMGLASRIDWIVPEITGTPLGETVRYYLAVKDVALHGGLNMSYNLTLMAAGKGLAECFDVYEPDGQAQDAKEIVVNEVQNHSFCPANDSDWVKFFAKAGRVYSVYTGFLNANSVGMDTQVYIWAITFDPNDPTTIQTKVLVSQNDDKSDGDLSSLASFRVPADGVYYAEIKNAGGVGRNGLFYKLNFAATGSPSSTTTTAAPTATSSTTSTPTATATVSTESLVGALGLSFGDSAFRRVWNFTDLPVFTGRSARSWVWGPPSVVKNETYADAVGGSRQVQYFDKSRMEINNPHSDQSSRWYVTNGLLAKEMVTGRLAVGDFKTSEIASARIPVAGDSSAENSSPTYASFNGKITLDGSNRASDQTGQAVVTLFRNDGTIANLDQAPAKVNNVSYIKETGHNLPDVFWNYLTSSGMVYDGNDFTQATVLDWVYVVGLPLSEPYWIKARVGGVEKDVLVQIFERRVLTFTPSNAAQWQVEMGNVGQHYYLWRYGQPLPKP